MAAQVSGTIFGSIEIAVRRIGSSPIEITQHNALIDSLFLIAVREGQVALHNGDSEVLLSTTEAAFVTHASFTVRSSTDAESPAEILLIRAPLELARDLQGFHGSTTFLRIPGSAVLLVPVLSFASALLLEDAREASGLERYYTERLMQEMALGLLVRTSQALPQTGRPDYHARAITVIASQCTDSVFSGASVASELNLSLRQLERIFLKQGITLGRAIRLARIDKAQALLRDRAYDQLSLTHIAHLVGLSSGSSLTRAMLNEGFPSPMSIRRQTVN